MVKVLFAGEPSGRIEALFKRVAAVNASNGPFDLLLCCGAFFAGSGARAAAIHASKKPAVNSSLWQRALFPDACRCHSPRCHRLVRGCLCGSALMLCMASPAGPDEGDYTGELLPYITGEKKAPIPTYFIGGWGAGSKQALEALSGAVCDCILLQQQYFEAACRCVGTWGFSKFCAS